MKNRVFGKFEVLVNLKLSSGYKVSVSDGENVLEIPLILELKEIEEGLERVRVLDYKLWTLEHFRDVVSGSFLIMMKYGKKKLIIRKGMIERLIKKNGK